MKLTVNAKEIKIKQNATFEDVALKAGFILKPSVWGSMHVLVNGVEREYNTKIKSGDDVLFIYENYNFKKEEEEAPKFEMLVAYLTKHGIQNAETCAAKILNSLEEGIRLGL